jgi:PAS domain S-box-containing protein
MTDYDRVAAYALELQAAATFAEVLDVTRREVEAVTGYRHVWLFVSDDPAGERVRLIDAAGAIRDHVWENTPILQITGDAMLEEIARSTAPVVVEDARTDPRTNKAIVAALGNRTIVNVPVRRGAELFAFGTGTFGDEGVRPPTEVALAHLAAIGVHLAAALSRLRAAAEKTRALLRASESKFYRVIDSTREGYIEMDHEGRIVEWNPQAEAIFGWPRAQAIERRVVDCIIPPHLREAHNKGLARYLATGQSKVLRERLELEAINRDGTSFPVELTISAIGGADKPRFAAFLRDITNRRRDAAALERARADAETAMREYEAFSYSVAHDLRAPLRAVDAFALTLREDYGALLDDPGRDMIERIHGSALKMAELIDDLLALARVARADVRREPVDLTRIARAVSARLAGDAPERAVDAVIAGNLRAVGDPRLLEIAMINLLENAWKFTRDAAQPRVEVGCDTTGERPVYFVRDNGAGFDMAHAARLFGVFQRLHAVGEYEGTGIGLATVERVVRRHGGRIWAESEPNAGATFYFTLGNPPR